MELRDYQKECLDVIERQFEEGMTRQMVVLPTGAGKTVIFSELIKEKNLKTLVIAHRIELLEQAKDKINYAAPHMETGIFCGDRRCHDSQVTIASIQSAVRHLDLLKAEGYQLLIIDEAHHAAAKSYRKLIEYLGFKSVCDDSRNKEIDLRVRNYRSVLGVPYRANQKLVKRAYRKLSKKHHPDVNRGSYECGENFKKLSEAYEVLSDKKNHYHKRGNEDLSKLMVGFTATPKRGDKVKLCDIFQDIVFSMSIRKLVNRGYLVKPEGVHVKVGIDLRKVRTEKGDFKQVSLRKVMLSDNARSIVVDAIKTFASERRGIVFGVDIEHSEMLKQDIQAAGFSCDVVHSRVSMEDRMQRLKDFIAGDLQFIVNPMILTEGFDCPPADCMINAAPTQNRSLYVQKAGRVLRPHPDKKKGLLIDFGITKKRHILRTAVDLMGEDIVMKTIVNPGELKPIKKNIPNPDLTATENRYDPLTNNLYKSASAPLKQEKPSIPTIDIQQAFNDWIEKPDSVENQLDEQNEKRYWKEVLEDNWILNPMHWSSDRSSATIKQLDFIKTLARATHTDLPMDDILKEIGINQASRVIEHLLEKKKRKSGQTPLTNKQAWLLRKLSRNGDVDIPFGNIAHLSKIEASRLIGRCKDEKIAKSV